MIEGLELWKIKEWLSIHESVSLILGVNPDDKYEPFLKDGNKPPVGWGAIESSLVVDLTKFFYINMDHCDGDESEPYDVFYPENVKMPPDGSDIYLYRIKQTAVKEWVSSKGLKPAFFFSETHKNNDSDDFMEEIKALDGFIQESNKGRSVEPENRGQTFLQKREWLTTHEISCLVCDRDINVTYTNDPDEIAILSENLHPVSISIPDDGYDDFYSLLSEAIKLDIQTEFLNETAFEDLMSCDGLDRQKLLDLHFEENDALFFKVGLVRGASSATVKSHLDTVDVNTIKIDASKAEIKVTAVKQWLIAKNLKPAIFFPEEEQSQQEVKQENPTVDVSNKVALHSTGDNQIEKEVCLPLTWGDLFTSPTHHQKFDDVANSVTKFIEKNKRLPSSHGELFTQLKLDYGVSQREAKMPSGNMSLDNLRRCWKRWTK
jgi:hypothetical protein